MKRRQVWLKDLDEMERTKGVQVIRRSLGSIPYITYKEDFTLMYPLYEIYSKNPRPVEKLEKFNGEWWYVLDVGGTMKTLSFPSVFIKNERSEYDVE